MVTLIVKPIKNTKLITLGNVDITALCYVLFSYAYILAHWII